MPFKLMGKSPLMKKLVGNQHRLPEKLKQFIKDAPGKLMKKPSPNKQSVRSKTRQKELDKRNDPNKEKSAFDKYLERNRQAAVERDLRQGFDTEATRALKKSKAQAAKGATEGGGSGKQAKIKGSSGIDNLKRIASGGATKSETDSVKKMKSQLTGGKKTGVKPRVTTPKKQDGSKIQRSQAEKDFLKQQEADRKAKDAVEPKKSDFTKSQFGKKVINRGTSFTDEFGTTFTRDVKGRKKADGSVSKTVTNKRDGVNVSQRDVTKGPKVKGQRRARTVTRTKFDTKGDVRKVVTKTRGQKRKVLSDADAKKKREELKKIREEREKSPTKLMKNKTPNKMMKKSPAKKMHKGGMKMMKKKSPTMMMKKSPSKKMMKAPMKKMMKKKK